MLPEKENIVLFRSPNPDDRFINGVREYVNGLRYIGNPNSPIEWERRFLSTTFNDLRAIGVPLAQIISITWNSRQDILRPIDDQGEDLSPTNVAAIIDVLETKARQEGRRLDFGDIYSKIVR